MYIALVWSAVALGATLFIAGYYDIFTRKVPFKFWSVACLVGVPCVLYNYLYMWTNYEWTLVQIAIPFSFLIAGFFYAMGRLHAMGGADSYAFIFISLLVPLFPERTFAGVYFIPFPAIPVFINSLIFFPFMLMLANAVEPDDVKGYPYIPAIACAFPTALLIGDIPSFLMKLMGVL